MTVVFRTYCGMQVAEVIDDLARLRIEVFREWPYLYDGDLAYEQSYLQGYTAPWSIVVSAEVEGRIVGAATGIALIDHMDGFASAFDGTDFNIEDIFYNAESVLEKDFRGQGFGHLFFDEREAHARRLGFKYSVFCTVTRPSDHPMRPAGYRPLDGFWRKRGYAPLPGITARFSWRDLYSQSESNKTLQFWGRSL